MGYIKVGHENSSDISLYYEDHGTGRPVVLIHGWPLSGRSWEKQTGVLLAAGMRVITYDRRGFGMSSKPATGYEYDTLAADLRAVLTHLDLKDAAIIGFSMGGGEVARYLGRYGPDRVSRAGFIGAIPPFLLRTPDNQTGVDAQVFDAIKKELVADRPAFLAYFLKNFYNTDVLLPKAISQEAVNASWSVAMNALPSATVACVSAWLTDFRADLAKITIPTLIVHGDEDRIVPLPATGELTHKAIRGSRLAVIPKAPHGLLWTHADDVNRELLAFLKHD